MGHGGRHLQGSPFALSVKSGGNLKEWKESRVKEVATLRVARKEKEKDRAAPPKQRAPSPRINPYEQLQKAYALALTGFTSSRGDKKSSSHSHSSGSSGGHHHSAHHTASSAGTQNL